MAHTTAYSTSAGVLYPGEEWAHQRLEDSRFK